MQISDLKTRLDAITERSIETHLGDLKVDDDARRVTVLDSGGESFALDAKVERSFGEYLGIPKAYLEKCPADLKATNLNYWFQKRANASAIIEVRNEQFVSVHREGLVIIPLRRVIETVSSVLDPSYEVTGLTHEDSRFQMDIITPHSVEVQPWNLIEDRNPEHHATVGDVTHGGIRLRLNPIKSEEPVVSTYLRRLWCSNGATSPAAEDKIKLVGNTVDEVIMEMEAAMRRVVGDLDDKLASYAATATKYPPGSKENFARQLGVEYKLKPGVLNKILDRVQVLPDGASIYDVIQVFTAMANEEGVSYQTILKLQEIGGTLAFQTEEITHRCGQCERLLP